MQAYKRARTLKQFQLLLRAGMAKAAPADRGDSKFQKLLKVLEPMDVQLPQLSPEELQERAAKAKNFSRLKMQQHRAWQKDLSDKLRLKKAAIAALPPDLQAAALEDDYEPFPTTRPIFTHTPPIPGFALKKKIVTGSSKIIGNR